MTWSDEPHAKMSGTNCVWISGVITKITAKAYSDANPIRTARARLNQQTAVGDPFAGFDMAVEMKEWLGHLAGGLVINYKDEQSGPSTLAGHAYVIFI